MTLKVAVQIAGLPRFSRETSDFIQYIDQQYPSEDTIIDWFFYLWNPCKEINPLDQRHTVHATWANPLSVDTGLDIVTKNLPSQRHAVIYLLLNDPNITPNPFSDETGFKADIRNYNIYQWLYANQACDRLRTMHERQINNYYNIVIKSRPDIKVIGTLPSYLEENKAYMSKINRHGRPPFFCNDHLLVSNGKTMTAIADMFNNFDDLAHDAHHNGSPHRQTMTGLHCYSNYIELIPGDFEVTSRPLYNDAMGQQDWGNWI